MRPRWKYEDKVVDYALEVDYAMVVDYAMEVDWAKMGDSTKQVNDTGSKQLATLQ